MPGNRKKGAPRIIGLMNLNNFLKIFDKKHALAYSNPIYTVYCSLSYRHLLFGIYMIILLYRCCCLQRKCLDINIPPTQKYLYKVNHPLSFLTLNYATIPMQIYLFTGFPKSKSHVFTVSDKYLFLKCNKVSLNLVIILMKLSNVVTFSEHESQVVDRSRYQIPQ